MGTLSYRKKNKKPYWETVDVLKGRELYAAISHRSGIRQDVVKKVILALTDVVVESLAERRQKVNLPYLGNFTLQHIPAKSNKITSWDAHDRPQFTVNVGICDLLKLKAAFQHLDRPLEVTADNWRDLIKKYTYTLKPGSKTVRHGFSSKSLKKTLAEEDKAAQAAAEAETKARIEENPFL